MRDCIRPYAKPGAVNDSLIGGIYDISIDNVQITSPTNTSRGRKDLSNHTSTIEGQPQDLNYGIEQPHLIGPNITISRVTAVASGGGAAKDVAKVPPHPTPVPWPRNLGIRPSYGFFLRRVHGVSFTDVSVRRHSTPGVS